jgi:hypothetical protein
VARGWVNISYADGSTLARRLLTAPQVPTAAASPVDNKSDLENISIYFSPILLLVLQLGRGYVVNAEQHIPLHD